MGAMSKGVQITFRVEQATVELADEIAELIGKSVPVPTTRAAVMRAALERGLAAMHAELQPPKRRK